MNLSQLCVVVRHRMLVHCLQVDQFYSNERTIRGDNLSKFTHISLHKFQKKINMTYAISLTADFDLWLDMDIWSGDLQA